MLLLLFIFMFFLCLVWFLCGCFFTLHIFSWGRDLMFWFFSISYFNFFWRCGMFLSLMLLLITIFIFLVMSLLSLIFLLFLIFLFFLPWLLPLFSGFALFSSFNLFGFYGSGVGWGVRRGGDGGLFSMYLVLLYPFYLSVCIFFCFRRFLWFFLGIGLNVFAIIYVFVLDLFVFFNAFLLDSAFDTFL